MSETILILGESGTGKSCSMRTLPPQETFIINVNNKSLPFKGYKKEYVQGENGAGNYISTDDPSKIIRILKYLDANRPDIHNIILDDFGYTFINAYMRRAKERSYDKFSDIGSDAWHIFHTIKNLRNDLFVFVMMHTEIDNHGRYKPKTVGKMMDSNNVIEGTFDYVLHALIIDGEYKFLTNNDGIHMAHTAMGMFPEMHIDNDLFHVKHCIEQYFNDDEEE